MLTNALLISGGSGILSALTFLMSVMQGAVLLIYLPLLPLMLVGFHFGFNKSMVAAAVGAAVLVVANDAAVVSLYLLFLGAPALIVSFFALRRYQDNWYPVLRIVTNILVYAAVMVAALTFSYIGTDGGLQAKIVSELSGTYESLRPELAEKVKSILVQHTYFLIATTTWLWALMVYLMALVAHLILDSYRQNVRPSFSLKEGNLPTWLLGVLTVMSVLSFIGSGDVQFAARGIMLMFLLPYFMLGMLSIHEKTRTLPGRGFLLAVAYIIIISAVYPVLFVALYGITIQLLQIGKPRGTNA